MKFSNFKYNIIEFKKDFILFLNNYGYFIDNDVLDSKFAKMLYFIKKTLKK
jgi:hypothetical protein